MIDLLALAGLALIVVAGLMVALPLGVAAAGAALLFIALTASKEPHGV